MSLPATGTITLGGITLSDHLVLRGLRVPTVAVDQQRTKGGKLTALVNRLSGGRTLELEGIFTAAQLNAVRAIEGDEVTLVHPRGTFSVMVIGYDLDEVFERVDQQDDDYEQGSIILLER
jgi:hypothetical protein